MKTSLQTLLILTLIMEKFCSTQMQDILSAFDFADNTSIVQHLEDNNGVKNNFNNYKNEDELRILNEDLQRMLKELPEIYTVQSNLETLYEKIGNIDNYYTDMVNYNKTYQHLSPWSKDRMIVRLLGYLQYISEGPISLLNEILNLLVFGSYSIINQFQENSHVSCSIYQLRVIRA